MEAIPKIPGIGNIGNNNPEADDNVFPVLDETFEPRIDGNESSDSEENSDEEDLGSKNDPDTILSAANSPTKRQKVHIVAHKAKEGLKNVVHGGGENNDHPDKKSLLHAAGSAIAHPVRTVKGKVGGTLATEMSGMDNAAEGRDKDQELVDAHDRKDAANERNDDEAEEKADKSIKEIQHERRNMRLAYIMGKQVSSVRAVHPPHKKKPEAMDFALRDENGKVITDNIGNVQIDWVRYAGELVLWMTQDINAHYIEGWQGPEPLSYDKLRLNIARIFIASGPWQQWFLHVRKVYRWEDPYETFRWLVLYCVLWYTSHVVGFVYGYIIGATLWRHFFPSIEDIRETTKRAKSRSMEALRLDERIQSGGPEQWLSPLAEDLGPWAQLQLNDLAGLLEVMNNFYEWQAPRMTFYSLCFFGCLFFISMAGDMEICMRIAFLLIGVCFFASFPISSRYPKYRFLVSPTKWLFWDVPTNAEWAFSELRLAAQNKREEFINTHFEIDRNNVSTASDDDDSSEGSYLSAPESETDIPPSQVLSDTEVLAQYECRSQHRRGKLIFYPSGLRFESSSGDLWNRSWKELGDMFKMKRSGIEIVWTDDEKVQITGLGRKRDQVFCSIIGYSGMKWQWMG